MNEPESLYMDVYKKLKEDCPSIFERQNRGVLYTIILELFNERDLDLNNSKTTMVCKRLSIKQSNSIKQDYELIEDLVSSISTNRLIGIKDLLPLLNLFIKSIRSLIIEIHVSIEKDKKMEWLVIAGCILVGSYFCLKYLDKEPNKTHNQKSSKTPQKDPIPLNNSNNSTRINLYTNSYLYLIVPAFSASNYINTKTIQPSFLETLINSASYFLCTPLDTNDFNENCLNKTEGPIPHEGQQEVIIKVKIYAHKNIIHSTTRYELKENLQTDGNTPHQVSFMACLRDLTGLGTFTRI